MYAVASIAVGLKNAAARCARTQNARRLPSLTSCPCAPPTQQEAADSSALSVSPGVVFRDVDYRRGRERKDVSLLLAPGFVQQGLVNGRLA